MERWTDEQLEDVAKITAAQHDDATVGAIVSISELRSLVEEVQDLRKVMQIRYRSMALDSGQLAVIDAEPGNMTAHLLAVCDQVKRADEVVVALNATITYREELARTMGMDDEPF